MPFARVHLCGLWFKGNHETKWVNTNRKKDFSCKKRCYELWWNDCIIWDGEQSRLVSEFDCKRKWRKFGMFYLGVDDFPARSFNPSSIYVLSQPLDSFNSNKFISKLNHTAPTSHRSPKSALFNAPSTEILRYRTSENVCTPARPQTRSLIHKRFESNNNNKSIGTFFFPQLIRMAHESVRVANSSARGNKEINSAFVCFLRLSFPFIKFQITVTSLYIHTFAISSVFTVVVQISAWVRKNKMR